MKIGLFTDTFIPSRNGIVTSISIFKSELEKKGHSVFVFCPMYRNQSPASVKADYANGIVRYRALTYPLLSEYRLAFPMFSEITKIRRLALDVIHFHTPFTMGFLAAFASRRLRIPLVQTYHTHNVGYIHYVPLPRSLMYRLTRWGTAAFCNACSIVLSPSSQMKEELLSYGVKSKIEVLPTGIEQHEKLPKPADMIRAAYDIHVKKRILITVGRLGKEKNVGFLLRAFALVWKSYPESFLLVVGDGPEKPRLIRLSKELGICDAVRFLGYVERNEVRSLLSASDLFLMASRTETQGLSLLEALAAGIPAVAVNALGVCDVLESGRGGYLVDGDEHAYASAVLDLLSHPGVYEKKAREAAEVAASFSPSRLTERLIDLYGEVASSR